VWRVNDKLKHIGHQLSSFQELKFRDLSGGKPLFPTASWQLELFQCGSRADLLHVALFSSPVLTESSIHSVNSAIQSDSKCVESMDAVSILSAVSLGFLRNLPENRRGTTVAIGRARVAIKIYKTRDARKKEKP
jgi:hypothetical protein